jgi:hypothetical protein
VSSARRFRAGVLIEALSRKVADLARVAAHPVVLSGFPLSLAFLIVRPALSSDLRALTGDSAGRHEPPSPGPSRTRIMPEGVCPFRVSRVLPAGRPVCGRLRLPEVPLPFDDVPRSGPVCSRPSGSATVPTPGFLTPSPASWLRSSSRVCFAPLPSLGSALPSERSPRVQVAHPSSGPLAPSSFFPVRPWCGVRGLVAPDLHRLGRRSGVVPGRILSELEAPFQRRSSHSLATARLAAPPGHPGPRTPDSPRSGRSVDLEAFFPARVRSHHAPIPLGSARGGRCSPGRSRPSRALLPPSPGPSHPPRPEASLLPLAARASRRDARPHGSPCLRALLLACATSAPMLETHDVGWTPRGRPKRPARCPSAVTGLIQPGPCCLSAAASTPMTFDVAMRWAPRHVLGPRTQDGLEIGRS